MVEIRTKLRLLDKTKTQTFRAEPMKMTPFDKFVLNMDQMFPKHAMFEGVEDQKWIGP